ncbi:RWD domain-containing protein 4 [Lingula anatina]|uniref:RWD domain-containing protein 4 n=1 Tax=Lingula anatina TaxID=7574 RepID=A0A1S3GZ34_LINAN|nr:RWD domain-containing protein 4 [Lingula anatina]XP_013379107.1 RWD domain-containing protein 4 [Lingula anatina]XP_013379116.1 RWD domain-containing protein 4 [Lingula anatina]XP_013379127.1 RWD domain-containing protein 4 [Lingula anatina]XP_013379135.1 RWD domain-containing protein 4 [Lingula anatina]XP_013379143.1 RWD domain-containing protein 4 [Lingula anatina]|eukprot:XP_013379098.1 RWD domain-containing protein 4 [Lingula anatina]
MTAKELQEEEVEVLTSIYDGDECFKIASETSFQYKIGEDGSYKSFLLEISWPENYPEELPNIKLDTFYNKHLLEDVKKKIIARLLEEAEPLLETAMTYTLIECAKENAEDLLIDQPSAPPQAAKEIKTEEETPEQSSKKKEKKEQLTKAQKRRMFDKLDNRGEKPRGYDWVDVVKHLSQTGKQKEES